MGRTLKGFLCNGALAALIVCFFSIHRLYADPAIVTSVDSDCCSLRFSAGLNNRIKEFESPLSTGFSHLRTLFENPQVRTRLVFWILSSDRDVEVVLKEAFHMNEEHIKEITARKTYRDTGNFLIRIDPALPADWLIRLLLSEYARTLMHPMDSLDNDGWLEAGMAVYSGWMIQAELQGRQADFESSMQNYYASFFKSAEAKPLADLQNPVKWKEFLSADPAGTLSQAVLSYLYLVKLKGPLAGPAVHRTYQEMMRRQSGSFRDAFLRDTGLTLLYFETELKDKYFRSLGR